MSAELYLIRHAEALGAGQADPGLSANGRDQARSLTSQLNGMCLGTFRGETPDEVRM